MHTKKLLDHFQNPRNPGDVPEATYTIQNENPVCGDQLRLTVKCHENFVIDARFRARGCTACIACASALTELLIGVSREALPAIRKAAVEEAVGGLIPESKHAALLCEDAVKRLEALWKTS